MLVALLVGDGYTDYDFGDFIITVIGRKYRFTPWSADEPFKFTNN